MSLNIEVRTTHVQTQIERERIIGMIHDFCRGETMIGKACANCVLNALNVCGEAKSGTIVPMERLKKAEKVIKEELSNG